MNRLISTPSFSLLLCYGLAALTGCASPNSSQPQNSAVGASGPSPDAATQMVKRGRAQVVKFMSYSQAEALRNMVGIARGIYVAPDFSGGSLILGIDSGTGFLMSRQGEDWSDPVFFTGTTTSAGQQVGYKNAHVIVLLLTDTALHEFVSGTMQVGGTGGITIGVGVSVSGAGGVNGGLQMLIVSTNEGLSLGGGLATISTKPAADLNAQAYGPDADVKAILAAPGGKYAPARQLRAELTEMVRQAWSISRGSPVTTSPTTTAATTRP